jgi:dephospho-CoA kinase
MTAGHTPDKLPSGTAPSGNNPQAQSEPISIPVIGLLGGIASGKSLVAQQLESLGAGILDGDRTGHEVLELPEVRQQIRQRWGERVMNAEGRIDRSAVASIVFAPTPDAPRELNFLEQLTHPKIGQLLRKRAADMAASGRYRALVLDAPVMLEAGWHTICDRIVFVDAPRDTRLARAATRGWSEAVFTSREKAQESLDVKRRQADIIIDNSRSAEFTREQVERFWHRLVD